MICSNCHDRLRWHFELDTELVWTTDIPRSLPNLWSAGRFTTGDCRLRDWIDCTSKAMRVPINYLLNG